MITTEGLRRQGNGGGPAHVTGSGSDRPLARGLLWPFRRTRSVVVGGLALCCAGLVGVAGAATITEFPLPPPNSFRAEITAGPDGAIWFTEENFFDGRIVWITPAGTLTKFTTAGSSLGGITAGPDGAL